MKLAKTLSGFAIVFTALSLVPGGAHLFALPNKIHLAEDAYFTVQGIYMGWALFGFVLFPAMFLNLATAMVLRRQPRPFALSLAAFLLIATTLILFFMWTYPANQATVNWTVVPTNWQDLRQQWEYSHAANAVLTFIALCAATRSALVTDWTVRAADQPARR